MQALYSAYTNLASSWKPATLKVGYSDEQAYKPRIIITGEKIDCYVVDALKKYTTQQATIVNLSELEIRNKEYDLEKDLLLLIIHKSPGNCPIRGFASFDGPLHCYKNAIFSFRKRAALVIVDSRETYSIEQIQRQANIQLPENLKKQAITINNFWYNLWNIANQVQALFQE